MIYQYTSIEKLKLILDSKKIRFTRLDKVDDKDESEPFRNRKIADKVFVSCWTEDSDENSALWAMYGDDFKGVRIGLKRPIFKLKDVTSFSFYGANIYNGNNRRVLILPEEMITSDYFIVPSFLNESTFYKKVEYVLANELENRYDKHVNIEIVNGVANITLDFQEIAKYKKRAWKHQFESRYVLGIIPFAEKLNIVPDFSNRQHVAIFINLLADSLVNESTLGIIHYDVDLNDACLNNIEILIGSKCDSEQVKAVERILQTYCSNYSYDISEFNFRR